MSVSTTDTSITITLPTIPSLTTYPLTVEIPTSYLRTLLRLVVGIATYMLFRPHIERLFRQMLGSDDHAAPQSLEGMRNKMRKLENERGAPIGGGRKVAIAPGSGAAAVGNGQAPKTRRKA